MSGSRDGEGGMTHASAHSPLFAWHRASTARNSSGRCASSAGAAPSGTEVAALVASCDADGNGRVDAREWRMRFAAAVERLQTNAIQPG